MTTPAAKTSPVPDLAGVGAARTPPQLNDVSVMIGGQGGDGTLTVSDLLGRYFRKRGLYVYLSRNVLSRIRGGHADASVRGSQAAVAAVKTEVDVLVAFDKEAIEIGKGELASHGYILYDSTTFQVDLPNATGFPFATLVGGPLGQPIFKNTAAYGALSVIFGFDPTETRAVIEERFKRRGGEALEKNLKALEIGRKAALETPGLADRFSIADGDAHDYIMTTGNQAAAMGFVVGGGRFFAGYPITPATEIMEYLQRYLPAFHGVVRQAEDELAAVNMIIGAAYAGARVMTSTSGPGLSLMTEGIGHAGAAEIPIVVADCQRVGPSTGQPTRHEQSDLSHLANLGHGEFPRFILSPGTPEEAFLLTVDALNLAERWRLPVILLLDEALCQNATTSRRFALDKVRVDRGERLSVDAAAALTQYKAYAFSESGRSAYAPPGTPGVWAEITGNEHDEWGHVNVNPTNRVRMMKKRMEKMVKARDELPKANHYGPTDARTGIITFGSTIGPVREAQGLLAAKGTPVQILQPQTLYPVPVHEIDPFLKSVDVCYVIEHNYTGQLARLLRETMPWQHAKLRSLTKYDGTNYRAPQIVAGLEGGA
jgi:2-oxoglutarate/2-oxoacid ferredoxin oxidoreductase subunit alpha